MFFSSIQVLFLKYNYSHYIKEGYELKKMDKVLFGNEVILATQITWRLEFDQGKTDYSILEDQDVFWKSSKCWKNWKHHNNVDLEQTEESDCFILTLG